MISLWRFTLCAHDWEPWSKVQDTYCITKTQFTKCKKCNRVKSRRFDFTNHNDGNAAFINEVLELNK